jgi:hypothetical protein
VALEVHSRSTKIHEIDWSGRHGASAFPDLDALAKNFLLRLLASPHVRRPTLRGARASHSVHKWNT